VEMGRLINECTYDVKYLENYNKNKIMLSGDFHANETNEIKAISSKKIKGKGYNPETIKYHIILGDCGFLFCNDKNDKYLQNWFNEKNYITLCVFGNHENYDRLLSLPMVDIGIGETVYKVSDKIYYLQRGKIYNIENNQFLALGGGESIDKETRTEGINWWRKEQWSYTEQENLFILLKNIKEVDYIISHTAPDYFLDFLQIHLRKNLRQYRDDTVRINNQINSLVKFKHWYCGHYHTTLTVKNKCTCLYKDFRFI
jgi:hypothetical protein